MIISLYKKAITTLRLIRSNTPFLIYYKILITKIKFFKFKTKFDTSFLKGKKFSNSWFIDNYIQWEVFIQNFNLDGKSLSILEIGSWEGLSACYILKSFRKSHLTCVDTWAGSDEHLNINMMAIERNFDFNTKFAAKRLKKIKMSSLKFFESNNYQFDLIYIDGSHLADDVLIDSILAFKCLKKGFIIFDDYLWFFYKYLKQNPAYAINQFLRLKKDQFLLFMQSISYLYKKNEHLTV